MKPYKIEFKWAFIFIATILLWSLMEKLLGFHDENIKHHPIISMLFFVPSITIFVLALREKKIL